jgi:hypothetical protein
LEILDVGMLQRTLIEGGQTNARTSIESELPLTGLKQLGFTSRSHDYSYPRMVRALQQGAVGVASILRYNGQWLTPKDPEFSCHQNPYLTLPLSIYKRSDNQHIPNQLNQETLKEFSVGYMRSVGKNVEPFISQPNFVPANNMLTLFKMLKNHRLDTVFADTAIAASWSQRLDFQIRPILQLSNLESFFCFSHVVFGREQAQRHSDQFYSEMLKLERQGFIERFLNTHNLDFYQGLYLPDALNTKSK